MDEPLDLQDVTAFLAVADTGSFTAAARRLGLAKSNVSRRVARLEQQLGARLLERTTRRLRLTEVGETYHVGSGVEASVLDLRWLVPLDREAVLTVARQAAKVLIVHEDSRTGGIGESLAAVIQESLFEWLDAPVRVIGALDTPVPYAPPLEAVFLPSEAEIEHAARRLMEY